MQTWLDRQAEIASLATRQLFFVGGAPRSGTTWAQHILDAHPDISCRGEGHFLQFLATPLGGLMQWRRTELEAKNTKLLQDTGGYPLPAPDDAEFLAGSAILMALARQSAGRTCLAIGEKTPENVFYFPNLKRLFPGAKFIGVARDPRDVLTSAWHLIHKPASDTDDALSLRGFIHRSTPEVQRYLRDMLTLRQRYRDDVMIVTFEDLLRAPEPVVTAMLRFLGMTHAPATVAHCVAQASFAALSGRPAGTERSGSFFRKGVAGDWRSTLTEDMSAFVLRETGGMFPAFGWQR